MHSPQTSGVAVSRRMLAPGPQHVIVIIRLIPDIFCLGHGNHVGALNSEGRRRESQQSDARRSGGRVAAMTKSKSNKEALDYCTIKGTGKVVKGKQVSSNRRLFCADVLQHCILTASRPVVGDTVLMRAQDPENPPYVARVEKIEADVRNLVKVRVRWYYRPEESIGGRRQFHGAKELFLSDHYDTQSADTIEDKCTVHTFKNYTKLDSVGSEDYFCRFEYKAATGAFTPDRVAVYCKCEMPYNPDDLMVQCESCKDCSVQTAAARSLDLFSNSLQTENYVF
eukprot:Gb_10388 [translate_table: standard]